MYQGKRFRGISILLAAALMVTSVNIPVFAQEIQAVEAGEPLDDDMKDSTGEVSEENNNKEKVEENAESDIETVDEEENSTEELKVEIAEEMSISDNEIIKVNTYGASTVSETGTVVVTTVDEFHAALADETVSVIQVSGTLSPVRGETDGPLIITRPLTIEGGILDMRYLGIVLGADVTFKNIQIDFSSPESNAIVANGHTLTLDGVTRSDSVEQDIHLFCGGITGYSYANIPAAGDDGTIIVKGASRVGEIYAGNLTHMNTTSSQYTGNSTIVIDSTASGTIGNIYGCGGRESMGETTGNLVYSGAEYSVTGNVDVTLYDGKVREVTGFNGKLAVNYQGSGNLGTPLLKDISLLNVISGKLQPAAGSSFASTEPNVSVASGGLLYLDNFGDITIGDFVGGGELVLAQEQKLTISGSASGSTKVYIGGIRSEETESAQKPISEHTYIEAVQAQENTFTFADWQESPEFTPAFTDNRNGGGSWTAPKEIIEVSSVGFEEQEYEFDRDNYISSEMEIPLSVEYTDSSSWCACLDVLELDVKINNKDAVIEKDKDGYIYYKTDNLVLYIYSDWLMITDETGTALPDPGTYHISITVPAEYTANQAQSMTAEVTLTVTGEVETISIEKPVANTNLKWNGSEQTGVPEGTGYTLTGDYKATEVGNYTAKAVLDSGYVWADGSSNELELQWSIEKAELEITTVSIAEKTYDGTTTANVIEIKFDGMQNGEQLEREADFTVSAVFDSAEAGNDKTVFVTVTLKDTEKTKHYALKNSVFELKNQVIQAPETKIQFEVQFVTFTDEKIETQTVDSEACVTEPAELKRAGYTFGGWYTSDEIFDDTTKWDFENDVVSGDMILYAKWESKEKEMLPTPTANLASGSVVEKGTEIVLTCETDEVQIFYTLDETNPTIDSTLYAAPIVLTETSTIKAIAVKEGYNNSEVAVFTYTVAEGETVTFTVTFNSNGGSEVLAQTVEENQKAKEPEEPTRQGYIFKGWYLGDILYDFENPVTADITLEAKWEIDESQKQGDILPEDLPPDGIIPDGIWSAGITDKAYTGSTIKQSFRVYDGTTLLKEKTDYTISYKNNKNAYTYLDEDYAAFEENLKNTGKKVKTGTFDPAKAPQVTIKMKGNYSGSKTVYFKIAPADISGVGFKTADLTVTYNGKKQTPKPTLTWNGKVLKYGTDFYVPEYDNAKKDKKAFTEPQDEPYQLTITGKKNFTGEIPITLTISNSAKQIAMNKVSVKGITNQKWNGEQITQTGFKVSYGKDVLTEENGDYTISWGANKSVGTGTVTFTGTGTDDDGDGLSYIGTKTVTFKITGTVMSKVTVSGVEKSYPFTGSAIKPTASLSYKANKNTEPVPLKEGTHYTVDYQKNEDKGTATILFTGLESGGYTGTKKQTFKITAAGVSDVTNEGITTEQIQVTFKDTENVQDGTYIAPYMKGGAKPEVIVTSGGMTLELNKDYTVSFSNNKKTALSTDKNAPSLTVKGKGNFTGSKKVYFTIAPKPLKNENGITIVAKDKIASTKKNGYRQSFKVYDSDGKALGSADYDSGNVVYTLIETQNEDGSVNVENKILDKNSIVPANSLIRITVQGKGNYAGGEAYGTYRILENSHDISKATIQIANQNYTGQPVLITEQSQFKPGKVYIKIGKETKELILGEDIEVVPRSYVKHVDKGTAKVTFRGIKEFGGTKTVSYKIGARSIEEFWKGIQARMVKMFN